MKQEINIVTCIPANYIFFSILYYYYIISYAKYNLIFSIINNNSFEEMTSFDNNAVPGIVNEFLSQSLRKIHQDIFSLGILIK